MFKGRHETFIAGAPVAVFGDSGAGARYKKLVVNPGETLIFNEIKVSRAGGSAYQTAMDSASDERLFTRNRTRSNLAIVSDTECQAGRPLGARAVQGRAATDRTTGVRRRAGSGKPLAGPASAGAGRSHSGSTGGRVTLAIRLSNLRSSRVSNTILARTNGRLRLTCRRPCRRSLGS